ncbi:hypothetical protein M2322_003040 [Rhodoblastus acidophilus]|uniref:hypothetical protein n=1 Tax=Rhodoblastus acidophilus TaxID=1074 RepID=UPI0022245BF4|nr:hypothetical protein [Rhodoblastus acidophilus]MCW2317481.1 hypothetical protein [Rhodoblastus acidophilus]
MAFNDCILSARDQGALTPDEADELIARYEAHVRSIQAETRSMGGPLPPPTPDQLKEAKARLAGDIAAVAEQKEWIAQRNAEVIDGLRATAEGYSFKGGPDVLRAMLGVLENKNNVLLGRPSVVTRADALIGEAHGKMEQMLWEFRRKFWSGKRRGALREENLIDEAFAKSTGDSAAKDYLTAWRAVADGLVDRFNALGGSIRPMDDLSPFGGYFPQPREDARILARMGEDRWVEFIKPLLGVQYMRDPLTQQALSPERLDEALRVIYWRKVTDGGLERAPTMQVFGKGALANQRQDHRFLIFKDGDAWRAYDAAMGSNGAYAAMMHHVDGLAKDVAALDVLGPNPAAVVEWMRQFVDQEAARALAGQPSLYRGTPGNSRIGRVDSGSGGIKRLWDQVRGGSVVDNMAVADCFQALRNFLMADQLASTAITAAFTDPFQQANARRFAGVPMMRYIAEAVGQIFSEGSKRDVTRAGVIYQDAMDHLVGDVRKMGLTTGAVSEASKYLPDRILTWTGLTPFTRVERRAAAHAIMFHAADRAGQTISEIRASGTDGLRFAQWLQGFGIGEAEWDRLRAVGGLNHGAAGDMLRPIDVFNAAAASGDDSLRELGLRYSEAVHAFQEEATPEGTNRIRAAAKLGTPSGSVIGELIRSSTMYMSFGANILLSLQNAIMHESRAGRRGWAYMLAAISTLTVGGAVLTQMRALVKGQDPMPVNSPEFWLEAFVRGGGGGVWGDYLSADMSRGPATVLAKIPGPAINFGADVLGLVDPRKAFTFSDEQPNRAKTAADFGRKYVPAQNMWWLKPVTQRLLWDQLQAMADPEAYRNWRRREKKLRDDTGQGVWWGPGDIAPRRAPDFSTSWRG